MVICQVILKSFLYTSSTSFFAMNRHARNLTDSTPASYIIFRHQLLCRIISKKAVIWQRFSSFFDKFLQHLIFSAKNVVVCRWILSNISEKNCCRKKMLSKITVKKYCQNILSKKTVIDSVFRQILTKNLKNFVECRSILAKNVVEKNCCRKKLLSNFMIRHHFQTAFFDKKFCRKMRSKNVVERSWYNLSKNTVKKCLLIT